MPRRKPHAQTHPPQHSRARTHVLADGWTQVLRGPPPRSPGLSTPHISTPADGMSIEKLRVAYERVDTTAGKTPFRREMEALLEERIVETWERTGRRGGGERLGGEEWRGSDRDDGDRKRSEGSTEEIVDEAGDIAGEGAATTTTTTTTTATTRTSPYAPNIEDGKGSNSSNCRKVTYPFTLTLLLALGSPSHSSREISRVALTQLSAANAWVSLLTTHGLLDPAAPRLAQDPAFNTLDTQLLLDQGWRVVRARVRESDGSLEDGAREGAKGEEGREEDKEERTGDGNEGENGTGTEDARPSSPLGEGERAVRACLQAGSGVVLLAPHAEGSVLEGVVGLWREANAAIQPSKGAQARGILVGNDLGDVAERRSDGNGKGEGSPEDRWWEGWQRARPKAARDPVAAREWFGVSLHWRGIGDGKGKDGSG